MSYITLGILLGAWAIACVWWISKAITDPDETMELHNEDVDEHEQDHWEARNGESD